MVPGEENNWEGELIAESQDSYKTIEIASVLPL